MGLDRGRAKMDLYAVQFRTTQNAIYVRETIKRAKAMEFDEDRVARLKACMCTMCHYRGSMIAGQAFSSRQCGLCPTHIMSGNTIVDVVCMPCAKENDLCRACGADLELRTKRRKHPVMRLEERPQQ